MPYLNVSMFLCVLKYCLVLVELSLCTPYSTLAAIHSRFQLWIAYFTDFISACFPKKFPLGQLANHAK